MIFKKLAWALALSNCLRLCGMELTPAEQADLGNGSQGSLLHVPELARGRQQLPVIPLTVTPLPGPRLLFSDLPEYIGPSNGVTMMEDVTPGDYRLYVYHVPGSKGAPKTISAVVRNKGEKTLHVRFDHYAFPKPGVDYGAMGVAGLMEFFTARTLPPSLSIEPGATAVLDPQLDQTAAADPQLVHALYEFHLDQPARVAVLQRDTNQLSTNVFERLPRLPRRLPNRGSSGAGRGLFPTAELEAATPEGAVIDSADGVQRLVLADGRRDPWVRGTDGLSENMMVTNKGSYGVVYHIRLAYKSSDGRGLAILVSAPGRRSSGETRPMVALKVSEGIWPGGWLDIAARRVESKKRGTMALVQKFAAPKASQTNYLEMIYSPPGGSSLPTPIYFVPFGR